MSRNGGRVKWMRKDRTELIAASRGSLSRTRRSARVCFHQPSRTLIAGSYQTDKTCGLIVPRNAGVPIQESFRSPYAHLQHEPRLGVTLVSRLFPCGLCHQASLSRSVDLVHTFADQCSIASLRDVPGASFGWTNSRRSVPGEVSTFPILLLQALAWDECQLQ
jgi:hypothetical protein